MGCTRFPTVLFTGEMLAPGNDIFNAVVVATGGGGVVVGVSCGVMLVVGGKLSNNGSLRAAAQCGGVASRRNGGVAPAVIDCMGVADVTGWTFLIVVVVAAFVLYGNVRAALLLTFMLDLVT